MSVNAAGAAGSTQAAQQAIASLQTATKADQGAAKLLAEGSQNNSGGAKADQLLSAANESQNAGLDISV
ncbi:MAG: hypothetical protein ACQEQL_02140 [Pseudomonadota bacterium]